MDKENLGYVGKNLLLVVIILLLALIIFAFGLMIGYGVIGDGDNMFSILSVEKWQEFISKFTGK
ncbi:DNA-directed RNA polymerase subunit beta [Streptococcus suis]|nr:DNA-directed RNA polymerase subunit beta [Streptococcus suis]BCP62068.1 DNA-directed RNA polymerase subunit beta [Streptococcus parasuis]NQP33521.1 DNA-directed RNA polymerase subunit beta [Streptococcus suis]NQP59420.1 DNA-directed RNA polymerase subunit beta [Streptococcus suis]GIC30885.1 DNA-directed RNA polymerase subunit beta [Streptococcus parasuis]